MGEPWPYGRANRDSNLKCNEAQRHEDRYIDTVYIELHEQSLVQCVYGLVATRHDVWRSP